MSASRCWIGPCLVMALVAAGAPAPAESPAAPARRPNVVLFLVDDMGWVDCGAYGSTYYQTPRIDAFATTAVRFTNAYAHPLCSPSRASILTGWYPARHGILSATGHLPPQPPGHVFMPEAASPTKPVILPESKNYLDPAIPTLPATLRAHGYRTAHIGKWHLGLTPEYWPDKNGFDVSFHGAPDPGPPGGYFSPYGVVPNGPPGRGRHVGTITDGPAGEYIVDRQAAEGVKFIRAAGDEPFYLQLWCYGVHGPWGHKPEYTAEFAKQAKPEGPQRNPIMASMMRSVDECFGRILDELEARGLLDDTIVVFYSDNGGNVHSNLPGSAKTKAQEKHDPQRLADWRKWAGDAPPTSNKPLREGKGRLYEGGTRVPLMWAWAGRIPAGGVSDVVAGHVDLFPTILDLVGLPAPEGHVLDGVSLAPVLTGTSDMIDREAFFTYFPGGQNVGGATVRRGDWKLIRWFDPDTPRELYQLGEDIGESRNLAASRPEIVRELDALIDRHFAETGALVPRANPAFNATAAVAARPLGGWVPKGCTAAAGKQGGLVVTGTSPKPFLGRAGLKLAGPVTLAIEGNGSGPARVQWRTLEQEEFPEQGQVEEFSLAAGTTTVTIDAPSIAHLRLYLPARQAPVTLEAIDLRPADGRPVSTRF
jgi:arylsulfatase A-like enzyme